MAAPGAARRSAGSASTPLVPGMATSRRMRSGRHSPASRTAPSALAASPTTAKPSSISSAVRSVARVLSRSSANSTRTSPADPFGAEDGGAEPVASNPGHRSSVAASTGLSQLKPWARSQSSSDSHSSWSTDSTPSATNTVGSGQNVTVVPVRSRGDLPTASSFVWAFPPLANSCR